QRVQPVVAALQLDQDQRPPAVHAGERLVGHRPAACQDDREAAAEKKLATVHGTSPHFNWYAGSSRSAATTAPGEPPASAPSIGGRGKRVRVLVAASPRASVGPSRASPAALRRLRPSIGSCSIGGWLGG